MKRRWKLVAYVVACATFSLPSLAQTLGTSEDEAAIRAVLVFATETFNKHDAAAYSRLFTDDGQLTNVAGQFADGRPAIEKFLAAGFAGRLKQATQSTQNVMIRFIRPDVAIVHVTNQISGFIEADGTTEPPHNEFSIRVFEKDNGLWRMAAFHNTTVAATLKHQ